MKYTLFGFNQRVACELNLDLVDLALIRWFVDYKDSKSKDGKPKMVSKIIDGEKMYWVKYSGVIKEFPILKFKNEDSVYRRFKKLSKLEILNHKTVRGGGTYSFYCIGNQYYNLLSDEYEIKSDTNPEQNNKSTNNKSTKDKEQGSEFSLFDSDNRAREIIKETLV